MVSANPNYGEVAALTVEFRTKQIADNLSNNNGLIKYLRQGNRVQTVSGGTKILEPLMYAASGSGGWYSGDEVLTIERNNGIAPAEFELKQMYEAVIINGLEMLQNAGPEQVIDLLDARVEGSSRAVENRLSSGVYGDGTAFGGKVITGIRAGVSDAPTTGIYGGIDRALFPFWRNQVLSGTALGGAPSAANIRDYMGRLYRLCQRGGDKPNVIVADDNYFTFFYNSLDQQVQMIKTDGTANAGWQELTFMGMPVICDGSYMGQAPADHMYMLNTNYLKFRPHTARNFARGTDKRVPINQDAEVYYVFWAGNITMSNAFVQGVLIN